MQEAAAHTRKREAGGSGTRLKSNNPNTEGGEAHPHEPESDTISGVTQSRPGTHGRTADERTVGRWTVGRTDDGWTDGARMDGRPT